MPCSCLCAGRGCLTTLQPNQLQKSGSHLRLQNPSFLSISSVFPLVTLLDQHHRQIFVYTADYPWILFLIASTASFACCRIFAVHGFSILLVSCPYSSSAQIIHISCLLHPSPWPNLIRTDSIPVAQNDPAPCPYCRQLFNHTRSAYNPSSQVADTPRQHTMSHELLQSTLLDAGTTVTASPICLLLERPFPSTDAYRRNYLYYHTGANRS